MSIGLPLTLGGVGINEDLPAAVSYLNLTNQVVGGKVQVEVTWGNPTEHFAGVAIVRKEGSAPTHFTDGVRVYDGTGASCIDPDVEVGKTYFYRAFPYNKRRQIQTIPIVKNIVPTLGQPISNIPIGQKIKFGTRSANAGDYYYWTKVSNEYYSSSICCVLWYSLTDLKGLCFDAKESSPSASSNVSYGCSNYEYSNIHSWLNSTEGPGAWFSAKYDGDNPPASGYILSGAEYASRAGFRHYFTQKERSACSVMMAESNVGGTRTTTYGSVILPSFTEMGVEIRSNEGRKIEFNFPITPSWFLSRSTESGNYVSIFNSTSKNKIRAANGKYSNMDLQINPFITIQSTAMFSTAVDRDGYYTLI